MIKPVFPPRHDIQILKRWNENAKNDIVRFVCDLFRLLSRKEISSYGNETDECHRYRSKSKSVPNYIGGAKSIVDTKSVTYSICYTAAGEKSYKFSSGAGW